MESGQKEQNGPLDVSKSRHYLRATGTDLVQSGGQDLLSDKEELKAI